MTHLPPGADVTPERAGWRYLSFSVHTVVGELHVGGPGRETAVVALAGGPFRVGSAELPGRASVWDGLPSAAYLPPSVTATHRRPRPAPQRGRSPCASVRRA